RRRQQGGGTAVKTAAWILVPLLIIGAFIGVGYMFLSAPGGSTAATKVKIPELATQTVAAAKKTLTDLGLQVKIEEVFDDKLPKDTVIESDPIATTEVDKNSVVTLKVSKGVEKVEVPDVLNMTVEEATSALENKGFKVSVQTKVSSRPQGKVFQSDPAAGEKAAKDSTVRIYVPKEAVEVPGVANLTVEDATRMLKDAGFKTKVIKQPSDLPEGTVLSQAPEAGAKHNPGTTITLLVSNGQPVQPTEQPTTDYPDDQPTDDQEPEPDPEPTETDDGSIFDTPPGDGDLSS
ncbi:PASTA domain-containing protein, partial [Streptosporangium algeriense]